MKSLIFFTVLWWTLCQSKSQPEVYYPPPPGQPIFHPNPYPFNPDRQVNFHQPLYIPSRDPYSRPHFIPHPVTATRYGNFLTGERPKEREDQVLPFDHNYLPQLPYPAQSTCFSYDGVTRHCRARSVCFFTYALYIHTDGYTCILPDGTVGVCCPADDYTHAIAPYGVDDFYEGIVVKDPRAKSEYEEALDRANQILEDFKQMELEQLRAGRIHQPSNLPSDLHQELLRSTPEGVVESHRGHLFNEASRYMVKRDSGQTNYAVNKFVQLWDTSLASACRKTPVCTLSPFRTYDGTCNSLKNPLWGSTNSGLYRLLPPAYADGMEVPRRAIDGKELPNPRVMSLNWVQDVNRPHVAINHLTMAFGQFIAHDVSRVAIFTGPDDKLISCCTPELVLSPKHRHPECYPIGVPNGDPNYPDNTCMEFVRAMPAMTDNCKLNPVREPMNQVTHLLDGSFIYGSDEKTAITLRTMNGGELIFKVINGEEYLPFSNSTKCGSPKEGVFCFQGGDIRLNQEPPILSLHIIYAREHNRVARILRTINPKWTDENLFQEARRILIAQLQHIVFNEFLPLVIDYETRRRHGLLLKSDGYSYNYDPRLKPNVLCEFQAAAFRMGHSLIQNTLSLYRGSQYVNRVDLKDQFFNPRLFYSHGSLELLMHGLTMDVVQKSDPHITKVMSRTLFETGKKPGMDIYAINVQRGRDVGVNGYNDWRERCGLGRVSHFDQLTDVIPHSDVLNLRRIYTHVDDIDLYTAGLMETPGFGILVGPTFQCIIANQFQRLKIADRFWYERYSAEENIGFTQDQLNEIRKSTMASILCHNTNVQSIQPLAFLKATYTNPVVSCSHGHIPEMNLNAWKVV